MTETDMLRPMMYTIFAIAGVVSFCMVLHGFCRKKWATLVEGSALLALAVYGAWCTHQYALETMGAVS